MPKIVDHDERRMELVEATWRIIARNGLESATMREIALEAGFANGALKPYFPTKDTLLEFAFQHVFNRTNTRITAALHGQTGLAALRAFCLEVLPLDDERVNEARIVVPFWQRAITDRQKAEIHQRSMAEWLDLMRRSLAEAEDAGAIRQGLDHHLVASQLLNLLLGAQIAAALPESSTFMAPFEDQLEGFLALLHVPALP